MTEEKIDLEWGKFAWQLMICLIALAGGIYASLHIFVPEESRIAFANTKFGPIFGALLGYGLSLIHI